MNDLSHNLTSEKKAGQEREPLGSRVISGRPSKTAPSTKLNRVFVDSVRNNPEPHYSEAIIYENCVEVRKVKRQTQQPPRHTRGVITRFTKRSRSRMLRKTGKIRNLDKPYFVTLTYPGAFLATPHQVKGHLAALKKRIKRRFHRPGMLWRLELKKRLTGASRGEIVPHYHLILWGMKMHEQSMQIVMAQMWHEIVMASWIAQGIATGEYDAAPAEIYHFEHGVKVIMKDDFRAILAYVSKYAAKIEDDETDTLWGRRWGVCLFADTSPGIRSGLTWSEHVQFRRAVRRSLEHRGSGYAWWLKQAYPSCGFTALGYGDRGSPPDEALTQDILRLLYSIKGNDYPLRIVDRRKQ